MKATTTKTTAPTTKTSSGMKAAPTMETATAPAMKAAPASATARIG
jgi:hypothetical protein